MTLHDIIEYISLGSAGFWAVFLWLHNQSTKRQTAFRNDLDQIKGENRIEFRNLSDKNSNLELRLASHYYTKLDVDHLLKEMRESMKLDTDRLSKGQEDISSSIKENTKLLMDIARGKN